MISWTRRAVGAGLAAGGGAVWIRYRRALDRIRAWEDATHARLGDIGTVDALSILPLVERHTSARGLRGEPGVSYRIRAGGTTLLFDVGFNRRAEARSPLVHNAEALGEDLAALGAVVLSHRHPDHVGGIGAVLRRTFAYTSRPIERPGLAAFVPADLRHPTAEVRVTTAPTVIAPGVALLPPLPAAMFWFGAVDEQALLVNVRGYGLVLVSGCGHPGISRMLALAERVLDEPVAAVVGGLHLPVHGYRGLAVVGSPRPPWDLLDEDDVREAIGEIDARHPKLVALSGHDSTPWTIGRFERAFADRYTTVRVGEEIRIPD